ncbi:hypothetical protein BGZ94_007117 [Podila epigama]|nr:hypothetical protein BGZ94_007117 [Podila epigama]
MVRSKGYQPGYFSENIPVMMARFASTLLLLVALLSSALVQAVAVYVKYYDYSNTIGGLPQERFRVKVQIGSYQGEVDGHTVANSKIRYCSNDAVFCVKALSTSCNNEHSFTFYYAHTSKDVNMGQNPSCDYWPKDRQCKVCNNGELSFISKGFSFEF